MDKEKEFKSKNLEDMKSSIKVCGMKYRDLLEKEQNDSEFSDFSIVKLSNNECQPSIPLTVPNVVKKQTLNSFRHLINFDDIIKSKGSINLRRPYAIEESPNTLLGSVDSVSQLVDISDPLTGQRKSTNRSPIDARALRGYASTISQWIHINNSKPIVQTTKRMLNQFVFPDPIQIGTPLSTHLPPLLSSYFVKELLDGGKLDISRSSLVQLGQLFVLAFYFNQNIRDIYNAPMVQNVLTSLCEIIKKEDLVTHLACGTCILTLSDLLEGTVTDTWLGVGCLAALMVKSKIQSTAHVPNMLKYKKK